MSTFSNDEQLPSLPVPNLDKTIAKYLASTIPFCSELEYLNTQRIIDSFKNGIGQKLQFYLREKSQKDRNWLEQYWLDYAYLGWIELKDL